MNSPAFAESVVKEAALAWRKATGWQTGHGPDLAPDTRGAERADYSEVVLARRLRGALLPKFIFGCCG